jgi:hypothetical protein
MTHRTSAQPRLFFLHVPKTAGMTMRHIAARQYPPKNFLFTKRGSQNGVQTLTNLSPEHRSQFACVFGHYPFGMHTLFTGDFTYATILRDPVQQIVSMYSYLRASPRTQPHRFALSKTLEEFITYPMFSHMNVLFLSGYQKDIGDDYHNTTPPPSDAFQKAKDNLAQHFSVVGLTEEFDTTLLLMRKYCGWQNLAYIRYNTAEHRKAQKPPLSDALRAAIEQACAQDIALYQYAKTLFEAQKQAYGPTLNSDLARFRAENQRARYVIELKRFLKHRLKLGALRRWLTNPFPHS